MNFTINKIVLIFAASTFVFSGVMEVAKAREPNQEEKTNLVKLFSHSGKFKEIRVINELIGYKIEIFLNKKNQTIEEKSQKDQNYHGTKDNDENGVHFIVTKIANNKTIASGTIDIGLKWITKDNKADLLKEVINKLKEQGITAMITEENDDILVITIKSFNEVKK